MGEKILDSAKAGQDRIEVVELDALLGGANPAIAPTLFYMQQTGLRVRFARFHLAGGSAVLEPGALHRMVGKLEMQTSSGGGIGAMLGRAVLSGETAFLNTVSGSGTVVLEPTFGHLVLFELEGEASAVIVDKGMFVAGLGQIAVKAVSQKNISSALLGGEGFFQSKVSGQGVVVFHSPVPIDELEIHHLAAGETLQVDGNFALLRSHTVQFTVQKSSRSWAATAVSGEGFLQTFKGPGQVWLAPTQDLYERLETPEGIASLHLPPGRRNTKTRDGR